MKKFWSNNKEFRYFVRTVFNATVAFTWSRLIGLEGAEAIIAVGLWTPILNAFTKYINTKFFKDLWVSANSLDSK